jgi:hypothetical protein
MIPVLLDSSRRQPRKGNRLIRRVCPTVGDVPLRELAREGESQSCDATMLWRLLITQVADLLIARGARNNALPLLTAL